MLRPVWISNDGESKVTMKFCDGHQRLDLTTKSTIPLSYFCQVLTIIGQDGLYLVSGSPSAMCFFVKEVVLRPSWISNSGGK